MSFKFKKHLIQLSLFIPLSILNLNCSPDKVDEVSTPSSVQETFGNWSPSFDNQTSSFTQTRTGSQGTQQTRTINVTLSNSTESSTEEIIGQDVNNDGDLFEEIEFIVTTFTASENLGSHQITTYEVIEDNDNGIIIGNEFISMEYGYIELDGWENFCSTNNSFFYYILGINSIGSNFNDNNFFGDGYLVETEILLNGDNLDQEYKLIPDMVYDAPFFFEVINNVYNQEISSFEEYESWEESYFVDSDGDSYNDLEEILNNGDPNDPEVVTNYEEYVSEYFCDYNGNLLLTSEHDNFITYMTLYNIVNGDYADGPGNEIFTLETTIKLNSDDNKYLIKGEGISESGLPVKIYFNGYLSLHDFTIESSKSSIKRKKLKIDFDRE